MYLVTGADGFIGKLLVERLRKEGIDYRALVRPDEDLLKPKTLITATKNIDIVIHLAGITHAFDKSLYKKVNAEGTKNLIAACRKNEVNKIIYISTRAISPLGGPYSVSKIEAEEAVKNSSITFTILRLAEVYGGNKNKGIEHLAGMIKKLPAIPIIGSGNYRLQPVYVKDVIDAIILASRQDKANFKTYNIAGPDVFSYNDLVRAICKQLNLKRRLIHIPVIFALACAYFNYHVFKKIIIYPDQIPRLISPKEESIEKAMEDFNYSPMRFKDGLELILNAD